MSTSVIDYATELADQVNKITTPADKKSKGQYFTSPTIAEYMANLSLLDKKEMLVLDCGSGLGILVAALVDRIIDHDLQISLTVDLFENDELVIPFLKKSMERCNEVMERNGNSFQYRIIEDDFILHHAFLFQDDLFDSPSEGFYDLVISNPPYFKVNKSHEYSEILKEYVHGQPNVYFMFMVVAEKLMKDNGQLVFITPRSYCSGAYFEKFREKFFEKIDAEHIHIFESRKGNFKGENVLQENITSVALK